MFGKPRVLIAINGTSANSLEYIIDGDGSNKELTYEKYNSDENSKLELAYGELYYNSKYFAYDINHCPCRDCDPVNRVKVGDRFRLSKLVSVLAPSGSNEKSEEMYLIHNLANINIDYLP